MIEEKSPEDSLFISMKRIFAYYKTEPRGRSWDKIEKTLKFNVKSAKAVRQIYGSIISKCRCNVKKIVAVNVFDDFASVNAFVRDYNLQAAKLQKSRIDSFRMDSFRKLLDVMDEEVLVKTRSKSRKVESFKAGVCREIKAGRPVLWITFTGIIKENPEVALSSGCVRLIIGCNPEKNEVIYTDNWGRGHAKKRLTWDKAWAITFTALAVKPK